MDWNRVEFGSIIFIVYKLYTLTTSYPILFIDYNVDLFYCLLYYINSKKKKKMEAL